jgi:hypothetical protein
MLIWKQRSWQLFLGTSDLFNPFPSCGRLGDSERFGFSLFQVLSKCDRIHWITFPLEFCEEFLKTSQRGERPPSILKFQNSIRRVCGKIPTVPCHYDERYSILVLDKV